MSAEEEKTVSRHILVGKITEKAVCRRQHGTVFSVPN